MTGADGSELFRPTADILAEIQAALDQPRTPPEPVTLMSALTIDPDRAWPCADFCCTLGCPGPGFTSCKLGECPRWCTCGQQHIRDVVRALQLALADNTIDRAAVTYQRQRAGNCRHPRWLPRWAHCRSCRRSTPDPRRGTT